MQLGTIESIWRYPVKGMRGEEIPHVYTGFSGLMGDRIYGVIADDGLEGFPWHTGRDQEEFVLYNASYRASEALLEPADLESFEGHAPGVTPLYPDSDAFEVSVETNEGETYDDIEDPAFIADLERVTGRTLRVHMTQRGQHDCRPLSIFSLSAAARLGEELGMDIDKRRFRANFYVEWDNQDDPYFEVSLVGKTLKIGDRLEVAVVERDPRCKMITLDPDTSEESPKILRHVSRNHDGCAGVFAAVLQDGRVKRGDAITLK
ncbi:MAG: MOSC domain-containing protein [Alphaproteobacteria bacterium]